MIALNMRLINILNAVVILPLGYLVLRYGDGQLRSAAQLRAFASGHHAAVGDVFFGLFVMLPISVGVTFLLFWFFKKEQRTLGNVLGIFSVVFGVLTCFYFLWTLTEVHEAAETASSLRSVP